MRLDYVFIDGFKNLNGIEIDFDESQLFTVIIGENGTENPISSKLSSASFET